MMAKVRLVKVQTNFTSNRTRDDKKSGVRWRKRGEGLGKNTDRDGRRSGINREPHQKATHK